MGLPISHVVFDVGGVLLDWNPEYLYAELIPDEKRRLHFLSEVCTASWNIEQDRGRDWREANTVLIDEFPEWTHEITAYRERWVQMLKGPVAGGFELLNDVRKTSLGLTILSNWNDETYLETCTLYPALKDVDGATVSGSVKLIKPDTRIFDHHEHKFGLRLSETVFIDDNQLNVEVARELGWQAIKHDTADQTRAELRKLRVL